MQGVYTARPGTVAAVLFDGRNLDEVINFASTGDGAGRVEVRNGEMVWREGGRDVRMAAGDRLVRTHGGKVMLCSKAAFHATYVEYLGDGDSVL